MIDSSLYQKALVTLRDLYVKSQYNAEFQNMVKGKEEVLNRYQPVFSAEKVSQLSEEEFKSFLLLKNNYHRSGLLCHFDELAGIFYLNAELKHKYN